MPRPTKATITKSGLGLTAAGTGLLLAPHLPLLATLAATLIAALYLGVVLPAVWSRDPHRRRAARTILTDILHILHKQ